jgi:hypothetical protein
MPVWQVEYGTSNKGTTFFQTVCKCQSTWGVKSIYKVSGVAAAPGLCAARSAPKARESCSREVLLPIDNSLDKIRSNPKSNDCAAFIARFCASAMGKQHAWRLLCPHDPATPGLLLSTIRAVHFPQHLPPGVRPEVPGHGLPLQRQEAAVALSGVMSGEPLPGLTHPPESGGARLSLEDVGRAGAASLSSQRGLQQSAKKNLPFWFRGALGLAGTAWCAPLQRLRWSTGGVGLIRLLPRILSLLGVSHPQLFQDTPIERAGLSMHACS